MAIEHTILRFWQEHQRASAYASTGPWALPPPLIGQGLLSFALPDLPPDVRTYSRINPSVFALQLHYITYLRSSFAPFITQLYAPDAPLFSQEFTALKTEVMQWPQEEVIARTQALINHKTNAFMRGVMDYHLHPYTRTMATQAEVVWRAGQSSLHDFGAPKGTTDSAPTILLIPSLINKAYILDLMPEQSLVHFLRTQGYRVFLLDWGSPVEEAAFDFQAYLTQRLLPAALHIQSNLTGPLLTLGYCMGGIFALALAAQIPLEGLILLATPWDFHAGPQSSAQKNLLTSLATLLENEPLLPADVLTSLFYTLHPEMIIEKFEKFTQWTDTDKKRLFVALEDWASDTVPLAKGMALDLIHGWLHDNLLLTGQWQVAGKPLQLQNMSTPTLVIHGEKDRICTPTMTAPLSAQLPQVTTASFPVGHTGLIVGSKAQNEVWPLINGWVRTIFEAPDTLSVASKI
jgi:polyhydroxyalkanoate synthase